MNYSEAEFDKAYARIIHRICKSKSPDLAKYILESSIKFAYAKSRIEKLNK
jgi:hypothetical protein|nr:hypothetical protein [Ruminococcus bromii]